MKHIDGDVIALIFMAGSIGLLLIFAFVNMANAYAREHYGATCIWCKKKWVGRGCGCIPRGGRVGPKKNQGNDKWKKLTYLEQVTHMAWFAHKKYLEERRAGRRTNAWCYWAKREAYLNALRMHRESRSAVVG